MYNVSITYEYPYGRVTYLHSYVTGYVISKEYAVLVYSQGMISKETVSLDSCIAISITKVEEE